MRKTLVTLMFLGGVLGAPLAYAAGEGGCLGNSAKTTASTASDTTSQTGESRGS